ncbi:MAG: hypothetical protein ACK4ML_07235 [Alishewanella aestuarii]
MSAVAVNWLNAYQQLSTLSERLRQPADNDLHQCLRQAAEINKTLCELLSVQPAAAIAQLSFIPAETSLPAAQAVKSWVLLALWARLKQWPAQRRDTLCTAGLLAACYTGNAKAPAALLLANKLKKQQVGGITTSILAGSYTELQHRRPWQVHHDSPLLTLALQLAQAVQPAASSAQALSTVISSLILEPPSEQVLQELNQLARLAPALYLCGRLARDQVGRYWLICQVEYSDFLTVQYWPEQQRCATELHKMPREELELLPPAVLLPQHWLDWLQMPALAEAVITTPKQLLEHSVLQRLHTQDLDAQVQLLQKQPLLAQYLLENASHSNRRQTLVHRLRHALAIFGQQQLPLAVARAELLQYLQLQASSQQLFLRDLQQLLFEALLLLGRYLPQPLTPQQAGVLAACLSAPLWHHPTLNAVPLSRCTDQGWLLPELAQQYLLEPQRSQRLSAALLHHYQLPFWAEAALCQYLPLDNARQQARGQHGFFLRCCWQLCFSLLRYPDAQPATAQLLQQLQQLFALPESSIAFWQQELLAAANPHCSL